LFLRPAALQRKKNQTSIYIWSSSEIQQEHEMDSDRNNKAREPRQEKQTEEQVGGAVQRRARAVRERGGTYKKNRGRQAAAFTGLIQASRIPAYFN
jgi:hypothetical protein